MKIFAQIISSIFLVSFLSCLMPFYSKAHSYYIPREIKGMIITPLNTSTGKGMSALWTTIFKKAGVHTFQITFYPAKRATRMLLKEQADIDIWRVEIYDKILRANGVINDTSELVRIQEHLYKDKWVIYALDPNHYIRIKSKEDLRETTYRTEYPTGIIWGEATLSKLLLKKYLSTTDSNERGLKRLLKKRTDLFITPHQSNINYLLTIPPFRASGIRAVGDIGNSLITSWFSKKFSQPKYKQFLLSLNTIIKRMRKKGEIRHILQKAGMTILEKN